MQFPFFVRAVKRTFILLAGIVLIAGCEFDEPDISNFRGFKLKKIDGRHIEAEFTVDCENPNAFGFKMKRADIDVSVSDQKIGEITLDEKVKVKRRSKNSYTVPVSMDLENGALIRLMTLSLKKEVEIRFAGKVRGSVWGIAKSFDVDETKTVDGSMLQIGQPQE